MSPFHCTYAYTSTLELPTKSWYEINVTRIDVHCVIIIFIVPVNEVIFMESINLWHAVKQVTNCAQLSSTN